MGGCSAKGRSRLCVVALAAAAVSSALGCQALVRPRPEEPPERRPVIRPRQEAPFTQDFRVRRRFLASTGANHYLPLRPNWEVRLIGREGGRDVVLRVRVLPRTRRVYGVRARVVEERLTANGRTERVTERYMAIDRRNANVFLLGESARDLTGPEPRQATLWFAGRRGATPGLLLPGTVLVGARWFQTNAPRSSLVRAEVVSTTDTVVTQRKELRGCVQLRLTSPRSDFQETLLFAPQVGLVKEGRLTASRWGIRRR